MTNHKISTVLSLIEKLRVFKNGYFTFYAPLVPKHEKPVGTNHNAFVQLYYNSLYYYLMFKFNMITEEHNNALRMHLQKSVGLSSGFWVNYQNKLSLVEQHCPLDGLSALNLAMSVSEDSAIQEEFPFCIERIINFNYSVKDSQGLVSLDKYTDSAYILHLLASLSLLKKSSRYFKKEYYRLLFREFGILKAFIPNNIYNLISMYVLTKNSKGIENFFWANLFKLKFFLSTYRKNGFIYGLLKDATGYTDDSFENSVKIQITEESFEKNVKDPLSSLLQIVLIENYFENYFKKGA